MHAGMVRAGPAPNRRSSARIWRRVHAGTRPARRRTPRGNALASDVMDAVTPSEGWGVLHLYYTIDRERAAAEPGAAKRVVEAVEALERDGHQALVSATLGHKADLGIMVLGPDLR